jgi:hypothetical protein
MDVSGWMAVASGIVVSAACGLRAFLPLFLIGLAARAGIVGLTPQAAWLAGDHALIALAIATALELAADKIPVVDHALDGIGLVIRPAAAWFAGYALLQNWPAPWGQLAALVFAGAALGVQAAKAKLRLGTTAVTAGHGNPVLSTLEDVTALLLSVAALLVPLLAIVLLVVIVLALRRRRAAAR